MHEDVPLVNNLLELYQFLGTFENITKLLIINSRVIQYDSIDVHHMEELARLRKPLRVPNAQSVILQEQCLLVHVTQHW